MRHFLRYGNEVVCEIETMPNDLDVAIYVKGFALLLKGKPNKPVVEKFEEIQNLRQEWFERQKELGDDVNLFVEVSLNEVAKVIFDLTYYTN